MILATLLVALMLAAMVWTVLRNGSRIVAPGPSDTSTTSSSATQ